jgi:hypothetical protein
MFVEQVALWDPDFQISVETAILGRWILLPARCATMGTSLMSWVGVWVIAALQRSALMVRVTLGFVLRKATFVRDKIAF